MAAPDTDDALDAFDALTGGAHPGFRPIHARGAMASGTFTPSPAASRALTRAPHAGRASTPVTVRFSIDAGVPTAPENDPARAAPQGMAVRFHLGDHVHTDIVAHSHDGFPARTGEELVAFLRAVATGPGLADFLAAHPAARAFAEAPKPMPASYARQAFFAITAFRFTNAGGASRFGRFRLRPALGTEFLSAEQVAARAEDYLTADLTERLARGPVVFSLVVQLAEPGDDVTDSTVTWPSSRPEVELGTLTLTERVDEMTPERRKIIFDPVPRVDGIDPAGDPLTEFRSALYLASGRRRRRALGLNHARHADPGA